MRNYKDKNGFCHYIIDEEGFITHRRNLPNYWLQLPQDIIMLIVQKVGVLDSLRSAQLVCTQWREICTDSSMWATTCVVDWFSYWNPHLNLISDDYIAHVENIDLDISWPVDWLSYWTPPQWNLTFDEYRTRLENIISQAVDQSCGSLFNLDLDELVSNIELHYAAERSIRIRRLVGAPRCFVEEVLGRAASRLPLLENFELVGICSTLSSDAIESIGRYFPKLSSLKIHVYGDEEAKVVARSMPQLRHICFPGKNLLTDVGVEALLDGCPHLESLDIRECYFFNITRAFQIMKKLPLTRTQWRDVLDDPSIWSTICVARWNMGFKSFLNREEFKVIIQRALDKSFGGLVDIDLGKYMSGDILTYVVKRCTQIRRLHGEFMLSDCSDKTIRAAVARLPLMCTIRLPHRHIPMLCSEKAIQAAVARLPLLEDLALDCYRNLSVETIETLRKCCPRLTKLKIPIDDYGATILVRRLPQLRHFRALNGYGLTNFGVKVLLDGCPHLECLNVFNCQNVSLCETILNRLLFLQRPFTLDQPCRCWTCYESNRPRYEDDFDYSQFFEEDVYDVHYTIHRREDYWSRREKARGRQLRRVKGNKNRPNIDKKRDRRRRDFETGSRREIKKEIVHWNKITTDPYKIMI